MSIESALELPPTTNVPLQPGRHADRRHHAEVALVQPNRPSAINDPVADTQTERDRAMEAKARAELGKSSYSPVRQVSCEVCDCMLTLRGRLPSFFLKQIAQTVARIEGIVGVDNQVEVDRA